MRKINLVFIVVFGLFSLCFAAEESITITTYYPSPYGSYSQLATNRLAVGDTDGDGSLGAGDQPNRDGDIRLKVQAGNPASWPSGTIGQVAYSSAQDSLYHYNGSAWVASGGGISFTYYCFTTSLFGFPVCSDAGGSQGYCPSGYSQRAVLGYWGNCPHPSGPVYYYFLPPAGVCAGEPTSTIVGMAYICSQ